MTSWDQELGATNKPLCVGCGGVGRTLSRCAGRAARLRLRRHGPTLQPVDRVLCTRLTASPAGWGGANSLVRGG